MSAQHFAPPKPFLNNFAEVRRLIVGLVTAFAALLSFAAFAADAALPGDKAATFARLESAGAVVREIHVRPQNIFDLDREDENNWLFRTANKLHVVTRATVIEQILLFKRGERVSVQKIDESERLLRNNRFIYDAEIRPLASGDGSVDIEVITRDSWSIDLVGSVSRSGGNNKTSFGLKEYNLLGTGLRLGFSRVSDEDRRGSEFEISYPLAFDGRTNVAYAQGQFNDGRRRSVQTRVTREQRGDVVRRRATRRTGSSRDGCRPGRGRRPRPTVRGRVRAASTGEEGRQEGRDPQKHP